MQFIRFVLDDGHPRWGRVAETAAHELDGAPYKGGKETGKSYPLEEIRLLPPVEPSKIVCIGKNYAEHASEMGSAPPGEPMFFLKAPSALIGPGDSIVLPNHEHPIHWEAELAVVIGRRMKYVPAERALDFVFGYTIANDVSDRYYQKADGSFGFGRAKSFDTFCPCGPVVVTEGVNPLDVHITLTVDEEVRQSDSTRLMIHPVPKILSHLSEIMTLMPGDLVLTGTPKGVGAMKSGDLVEISIPGIGTLSNSVV